MLKLKNITKEYKSGEDIIHALKGVSLTFRENEFVSILGQSGCGKTTMLNIIGGLDQYTNGDLIINHTSTKHLQKIIKIKIGIHIVIIALALFSKHITSFYTKVCYPMLNWRLRYQESIRKSERIVLWRLCSKSG